MSIDWMPGVILATLAAVPAVGRAGDEPQRPLPDEAFLEYLGSWDGDDEDWLVAESPLPVLPPEAGRKRNPPDAVDEADVPPTKEQTR
jgi:hypothetical protein